MAKDVKDIFDQMGLNLGYIPICQHKSFMNGYKPCERDAAFSVPTQGGKLLVCRYHVTGFRRRGWQGIERLEAAR